MPKQIHLIQTTPEELGEKIVSKINKRLLFLENRLLEQEPSEYLTRNQTAKYFKVDVVTIYHWTKKGVLKAYKVSNRVYYKREEIEKAMVEVKQPQKH